MEKIPLISFVDFVVASGTSRLTRVREIKKQLEAGYSQWKDYYKDIREAIVDFRAVPRNRSALERAIEEAGLSSDGKRANYAEVVKGYERFLKTIEGARPLARRAEWVYRDLTVVVNPELRVDVKGVPHWVKLYFKPAKLTRQRVGVALELMWESLSPRRAKVAILDARRGTLHVRPDGARDLGPLLIGDALAFRAIWHRL